MNPRKFIPVTLLIFFSCDPFLFSLFDTMVAIFAFVWLWLMCLRDYYLCICVIVLFLYNFAICVALPPVFWFLLLPNSGKRPFLPFPSQITTKDDIPFLKRYYLPHIFEMNFLRNEKADTLLCKIRAIIIPKISTFVVEQHREKQLGRKEGWQNLVGG